MSDKRPFVESLAEIQDGLKRWHQARLLRDYGMQLNAERQIAWAADRLNLNAINALVEATEAARTNWWHTNEIKQVEAALEALNEG